MEWTDGPYKISSDKSLLSPDSICALLRQSYWADKRPEEAVLKSLQNSVCYGVYHDGAQVGFGRVITDHATAFYLCDVIVDEAYRGRGLGKKLVQCIVEDFGGLAGILATGDAHGLYAQYGFALNEKNFMRRPPSV